MNAKQTVLIAFVYFIYFKASTQEEVREIQNDASKKQAASKKGRGRPPKRRKKKVAQKIDEHIKANNMDTFKETIIGKDSG